MRRSLIFCAAFVAVAMPQTAIAAPPNGLGLVRILGPHASRVLAPNSGSINALVAIPSGKSASDLGVIEIAPGIGRTSGSAAQLLAFGTAHPDVQVEVMPPLHALLANAQIVTRAAVARGARGADGTGTAVGIVDTGIDCTLPDFRDLTTLKSRIAWMLDLSMAPLGIHPELETKFGVQDANGNPLGAVLTGADIDMLLSEAKPVPIDPNGHGTHVASIAAGNGGGTGFIGMAPAAALVIARVSRTATGSFNDGDIIIGESFAFDRATAMGVPIAVNFSLGTDFGPHDGNSLLEKAMASFAGPTQPGRVVVAAAGNSGDILSPIHQGVEVTGVRVGVPVVTTANSGSVQVWVALRAGSDVKVGLDGPDGTWVSPISNGNESGHNSSQYQSGVIYGDNVPNTQVPKGSTGAIVVWSGTWSSGTYNVTLEGHGYADLYVAGFGPAALPATHFAGGVRDATVTMPGSSPGIIGVGCTVDSASWTSLKGQKIGSTEPVLDAYGGLPANPLTRQLVSVGEICYFSSAGPSLTGVPKPDILAPGGIVIGAMSQQALPGTPNSIFNTSCPIPKNGDPVDPSCTVVDSMHAVASGTSMSSPMVAGIAALLLQRNPTLTQDMVRALLQAGAHKPRGPSPYFDQTGPGEVDALGALEALDELTQPDAALPDPNSSWMTLSEDFAVSDGSTPLTATLELRTTSNTRATLFDASRLASAITVDGAPLAAAIVRTAAPGLFTFTLTIPPGHANGTLTLGATFDGAPVVTPITIPVALDSWTAGYPPFIQGGCNASHTSAHTHAEERAQERESDVAPPLFLLGLLALRRRAR